ncbi:MAG: tRNA pseudouridine(55) synthase TruB [Bacteroides sp.]|nr:tRNA pseudouridine(55) synthase TruB [Bacteroides sp.]
MVTDRDYDFISGEVLTVDKPLGWTSFDVVKRLRSVITRRLGVKKFKVGHAGTLDPLATGVILVTTGRATKLIDTLQAGVKEYVATLALGSTTPSFDLETDIDATYPTHHITRELIDEVLTRFMGRIEQVPPAFSACKIDGRRAYDLARKGRDVELKPKVLVIDEIEVVDFNSETMSLTLRIVCSKGTYIRALARDIGAALGSGAHLTALRRTRVGNATLDSALSIDGATELLRNCTLAPIPDNDNSDSKK